LANVETHLNVKSLGCTITVYAVPHFTVTIIVVGVGVGVVATGMWYSFCGT